jgi:hypothetical protein
MRREQIRTTLLGYPRAQSSGAGVIGKRLILERAWGDPESKPRRSR